MKFGMVLPTCINDRERENWARASFESLSRTRTDGLDAKPLLFTITKGQKSSFMSKEFGFSQFEVKTVEQPSEIRSNDGCLVWAFDQLVKMPDISHMFLLTDDWLYNPWWIAELTRLIRRKPGAKAWWVYRSTYEDIHKTIRIEKDAVLVKSINAGGCITVQEHREWGMDWRKCPRENGENGRLSLDLVHPQQRPGDRWVIPQSYILNIGMRGVCQRPEINDFAKDFVGVE